eukprot:587999-Prymnesium_polylepis.1
MTLAGVLCSDFYLICMERAGNIPLMQGGPTGSQASRAKVCLKWYNAMASLTERKQLLDKEHPRGEKLVVIKNLNELVIKRIKHAVKSARMQ